MLTVVYKVKTYKGKEEEFVEIANTCTKCAHSHPDCIYYTFFKSLTNPSEFVVVYKFKDIKAQEEHIEKLKEVLGPSSDCNVLPDKFINLLEDEEIILFEEK